MTTTAAPRRAATGGLLLAVAVLLVSLNLRAPIVSVSSVVEQIRADLALSAAAVGLLTSLPVLCFAVASPFASWLIARLGIERALLAGVVVLGVGVATRSAGTTAAAMVGTVLIGCGITVGNVAIPVVIGRDFPHRAGGMLGAYVVVTNLGSVAALFLTVPLAAGIGWRWALAAWALLVGLSALVWWVTTRHRGPDPAPTPPGDDDGDVVIWWRRPVVWGLLVAFAAHAFSFYGITAWLPEILGDLRGLDAATAGAASSVFQVAALGGAAVVPAVRAATGSLRAAFAVMAACWIVLPGGLLVAPDLWWLWCGFGGVAQGGGFAAIVAAIIARARDAVDNRRMSALVQGGGYAVAAVGPSALGAVHDASASWTVPLLVILASVTVLTVAGLASVSARPALGSPTTNRAS